MLQNIVVYIPRFIQDGVKDWVLFFAIKQKLVLLKFLNPVYNRQPQCEFCSNNFDKFIFYASLFIFLNWFYTCNFRSYFDHRIY